MLSRVLSAVACGGFWAVAAVHTTRISPAEVHGRALASLVGGLTVANLVGVPMGTWIGAQFGWRATFSAVATVTALAAVLIAFATRPRLATAPRPTTATRPGDGPDTPTVHLPTLIRAELVAFQGPRIWLALTTTALFQASVFAAFSYFSPLLTQIAGIPHEFVPGVLAAFGIGAFVGVVVGGRLADRSVFGNIVGSLSALAVSLFALWLVADVGWAAIVAIVLIGASGFSIAGALNARVFQIATEAPTLAASVNTSAFNVGNALGPAAGAAVIAVGWGFRSPVIVAILLALAALAVAGVAIKVERVSHGCAAAVRRPSGIGSGGAGSVWGGAGSVGSVSGEAGSGGAGSGGTESIGSVSGEAGSDEAVSCDDAELCDALDDARTSDASAISDEISDSASCCPSGSTD